MQVLSGLWPSIKQLAASESHKKVFHGPVYKMGFSSSFLSRSCRRRGKFCEVFLFTGAILPKMHFRALKVKNFFSPLRSTRHLFKILPAKKGLFSTHSAFSRHK